MTVSLRASFIIKHANAQRYRLQWGKCFKMCIFHRENEKLSMPFTQKSCKAFVNEPAWVSCINNGFLTVSEWQSNPFQPTSRLRWRIKPIGPGQIPLQNPLAAVKKNRTAGDQRESVVTESSDRLIHAYKTGTPAELKEVCLSHRTLEVTQSQRKIY